MIFSAAWRDGFFGRFLSALEPKKSGKKSGAKWTSKFLFFLNEFLFFFRFLCVLAWQDGACSGNVFSTFFKCVGVKKSGQKSEKKVVQNTHTKKKNEAF